jgi:hypothetical protein
MRWDLAAIRAMRQSRSFQDRDKRIQAMTSTSSRSYNPNRSLAITSLDFGEVQGTLWIRIYQGRPSPGLRVWILAG